MAKRAPQDRAARKRADRKKRRRDRSGSGEAAGGVGGMMMGMRGGFKKAVHGKKARGGRSTLVGWLPILVIVFALLLVVRRLGLF